MKKSVRRAPLAILLASISVIAAGVLRAEPPPRVPQGGGVIVDFLAVGMNGQAVPDLKPADVSIKVGGKQRTVASLEFMKTDSGGAGTAAAALPPPFAVNGGGGAAGRNLLIVIDNESLRTGTERAIRESLDQVLSQFGPNDRVAFHVAPRDSVQLGFGSSLAAVRAAVAKFAGIRPANPSDTENACRSRDSLTMLRTMMDSLAGSETPTSVLFIASGLTTPGNIGSNTSSKNASSLTCEVLTEHYSGVASGVANGRVNLYVAQGDDSNTGRDNGLENLAGVGSAGGVLRAIPGGLTRILSDNTGYYIATLQPESSDKPGGTAKLEVKVAREGVSARARADLTMSMRRAAGKAMSPREMVATTAPFNDLQLRVTAVAQRGTNGKMAILALLEPVDPSVKLTQVSAVLVAPGAAKAAFARTLEEKELVGRPMPIGLVADPGKYRMRIAAVDSTGKAGAVDYDLDASLTPTGPLMLGQVMLVGPRGDGFSPQLIFSNEPEIAAYVELYGPVASSKIAAKIDIAATPDGKAIVEGPVGGSGTGEPDKFSLNAKLPIKDLPPGDYVVRVTVQAEGSPEAKVMRTMRKVVK
jgi:hypothetical protein